MIIKISPCDISGSVALPCSKSEAIRLLFCAALANRQTKIICETLCDDIKTAASCLNLLCADIDYNDGAFSVVPRGSFSNAVCDCNESAAVLRFLVPIAASCNQKVLLNGSKRLFERTVKGISADMQRNGCDFHCEIPAYVHGLLPENAVLDCSLTSQSASGFLFAFASRGFGTLKLENKVVSRQYLEMTEQALRLFGVEVASDGLDIKVCGKPRGKGVYTVGSDFSNAAFFAVAGLVCGDIELIMKKGELAPSDNCIFDVLINGFGADITKEPYGYKVKKSDLHGCTLDFTDMPDLFLPLCVAASVAKGKSVFNGIKRLCGKESDRLSAACKLVKTIGADCEYDEDRLIISGCEKPIGGYIDSENDHRLAMSAAVAGCFCENGMIIGNAECVKKSYESFFDDLASVGGRINEF